MTRTELLLVMLMEECDETSQRASKAIRFTLEEVQPHQQDKLTNAQRIVYEFNDIVAVMEKLMEEGVFERVVDRGAINKKKIKIEEWLSYSKQVGTLNKEILPFKDLPKICSAICDVIDDENTHKIDRHVGLFVAMGEQINKHLTKL